MTRPLWDDEVYDRLAALAEPDLIASARAWLCEYAWAGRRGVEFWGQTTSAASILKGLHRHYPDGIAGFTRAWMEEAGVSA